MNIKQFPSSRGASFNHNQAAAGKNQLGKRSRGLRNHNYTIVTKPACRGSKLNHSQTAAKPASRDKTFNHNQTATSK